MTTMQKRLYRFLETTYPTENTDNSNDKTHIDFQVCRSMSHFNWFARYDAQQKPTQLTKPATEKL
jgi:hypothetical protein